MGRAGRRHRVVRLGTSTVRGREETLAVEEPLEIRLGPVGDGGPAPAYTTTMRTPGRDVDLIHGFLLADGIVDRREDIVSIRYCAGSVLEPGDDEEDEAHGPAYGRNTYNVVEVALGAAAAERAAGRRRGAMTSSSCGVCGTTAIADLLASRRYPQVPEVVGPLPAGFLLGLPDRLREGQRLFDRTAGVHGCGLFACDGRLLDLAEDVGRHNAMDKVVGAALREGRLPVPSAVAVLSGRASFDLLHKAALAGVRFVVCVSVPSSLAVELAQAAGITLVGFVRGRGGNVYSHPERVVGS